MPLAAVISVVLVMWSSLLQALYLIMKQTAFLQYGCYSWVYLIICVYILGLSREVNVTLSSVDALLIKQLASLRSACFDPFLAIDLKVHKGHCHEDPLLIWDELWLNLKPCSILQDFPTLKDGSVLSVVCQQNLENLKNLRCLIKRTIN